MAKPAKIIQQPAHTIENFDFLELAVESLFGDPDVSNPLRLRKVTDRIGAELFPMLTVYTSQAKYFGLMLYWAKHGWLDFRNQVSRLDHLMMKANLLVELDGRKDLKSPVGARIFRSWCEGGAEVDMAPTSEHLAIGTYEMYRKPVIDLGLLDRQNRLTDAGEVLVRMLDIPSRKDFLDAVTGFVRDGKSFPKSKYPQLKRWDVNEISGEYRHALKEVLGVGRTRRGDALTQNLGAMLKLVTKARRLRDASESEGGNESDRFVRRAPRWEKELSEKLGWMPQEKFKFLRPNPLKALYRIDRVVFFSQSIFELVFMRAYRSSDFEVSLEEILKGVDMGAGDVEDCRLELCRMGHEIKGARDQEGKIRLSAKQSRNLLRLAWQGYQAARELYGHELKIVFNDLVSGLDRPIAISKLQSGSIQEVVTELVALHQSYTRTRGVSPWMTLDHRAMLRTERADPTYLPSFSDLGADGRGGLFTYRINVMAALLKELK